VSLRAWLGGSTGDLDALLGALAGRTPSADPRRLLAFARLHGVLGLTLVRAPSLAASEAGPDAAEIRRAEIARAARVRRHAAFVTERLGAYGIDAILVGGIDFADALHDDPRLRPVSAVEVLVPRERWADAATVLTASGHAETPARLPPRVPATRRLRAGDLAVTVSWNLVSERHRGHASVEHVHLAPGPAARLVIVAALAAYRHWFDRLFLLVDLAGAAARVVSPEDVRALQLLVDRTGTGVAVDAGLALVHRLLGEHGAEGLRRRIFGTSTAAIPETAVLDARRALAAAHLRLPSPARLRLGRWLRRARPLPAART
jgi:hypothetical protein